MTTLDRDIRALLFDVFGTVVDWRRSVRDGLADGELLVLTALATVVDGTPVRVTIDGEPLEPAEAPSPNGLPRSPGSPGSGDS
mgnify:CR=1 FL=1